MALKADSGTDLVKVKVDSEIFKGNAFSRQLPLFKQLEADLLNPGNLLVVLNHSLATISPEGEMEYIFGWEINMGLSLRRKLL